MPHPSLNSSSDTSFRFTPWWLSGRSGNRGMLYAIVYVWIKVKNHTLLCLTPVTESDLISTALSTSCNPALVSRVCRLACRAASRYRCVGTGSFDLFRWSLHVTLVRSRSAILQCEQSTTHLHELLALEVPVKSAAISRTSLSADTVRLEGAKQWVCEVINPTPT